MQYDIYDPDQKSVSVWGGNVRVHRHIVTAVSNERHIYVIWDAFDICKTGFDTVTTEIDIHPGQATPHVTSEKMAFEYCRFRGVFPPSIHWSHQQQHEREIIIHENVHSSHNNTMWECMVSAFLMCLCAIDLWDMHEKCQPCAIVWFLRCNVHITPCLALNTRHSAQSAMATTTTNTHSQCGHWSSATHDHHIRIQSYSRISYIEVFEIAATFFYAKHSTGCWRAFLPLFPNELVAQHNCCLSRRLKKLPKCSATMLSINAHNHIILFASYSRQRCERLSLATKGVSDAYWRMSPFTCLKWNVLTSSILNV